MGLQVQGASSVLVACILAAVSAVGGFGKEPGASSCGLDCNELRRVLRACAGVAASWELLASGLVCADFAGLPSIKRRERPEPRVPRPRTCSAALGGAKKVTLDSAGGSTHLLWPAISCGVGTAESSLGDTAWLPVTLSPAASGMLMDNSPFCEGCEVGASSERGEMGPVDLRERGGLML